MVLSVLTTALFANNVEDGVDALKKGDYESALANFIYAANSGDKIAQQNLGVMYHSGFGVTKNRDKAAYWFNMAKEDNQHGVNCGCKS